MGTSALIGYKENDQVTYAYVAYDGYPDYVGALLKEKYNTLRMAKKLVALSDFELLKATIKETEKKVYTDTRYWQPCSLSDYYKEAKEVDYLYLFDEGEWKVKGYRDKGFKSF